MTEVKPVAWIVGNSPFGPYLFRRTEPKDWSYSEPLIRQCDHESAIDALRASEEMLRAETFQLYVDANEARIDAEKERDALRAEVEELRGALLDLAKEAQDGR